MPKGLLFWIVYILCLLAWLGANVFGFGGPMTSHLAGGGIIEFVLFGLLGWTVFGPPIQ